jgi:hypothetical protein
MSPAEQELVMTRVAALERQNRLLWRLTLVLALLAAAAAFWPFVAVRAEAFAPAPRSVSVDRLAVRDESGKERIVLKVEKDTPLLQILNSAGKPVAQMGYRRLSFIHFIDSNGRPRMELAAGDTSARLALLDEHADRAEINVGGDNPLLRLRDEKHRRVLEVVKEGPRLTFFDGDGKPLFTKP